MDMTKLTTDGSDAGFTWDKGEVSYEPTKGQKVLLAKDAPHVKVIDVEAFEKAFPGVILAALNGTSIKVACQAVTRRALLRAKQPGVKPPTDDEMRLAVLNSLRGIKNRSTVIVRREYAAFGQTFGTLEEAKEHARTMLLGKGYDEALVTDVLDQMFAEFVDDEVDAEAAADQA